MSEDNSFWDFYWDTRLQPMENLGKRAAILAASEQIRAMAARVDHPLRLLELGCGEGQVLGPLLDAHNPLCNIQGSAGVDYNAQSLALCRRDYPGPSWLQGDFTDHAFLASLGKFDIVLLVNALHEVFSDAFSPVLGEIDIPAAKQQVERALAGAVGCLGPGGTLVLFDGLEPPGDPLRMVRIRFRDSHLRQEFKTFAREYHPLKITYRSTEDPLSIELPQRSFTRYITKSIFLGKRLWETERLESYQYFTADEFRSAFARQNLEITRLHTLTVNEEKWRQRVTIESPGVSFPEEHILILAQFSNQT